MTVGKDPGRETTGDVAAERDRLLPRDVQALSSASDANRHLEHQRPALAARVHPALAGRPAAGRRRAAGAQAHRRAVSLRRVRGCRLQGRRLRSEGVERCRRPEPRARRGDAARAARRGRLRLAAGDRAVRRPVVHDGLLPQRQEPRPRGLPEEARLVRQPGRPLGRSPISRRGGRALRRLQHLPHRPRQPPYAGHDGTEGPHLPHRRRAPALRPPPRRRARRPLSRAATRKSACTRGGTTAAAPSIAIWV